MTVTATASLFCDIDLAAQIERSEAQLMRDCVSAAAARGANAFAMELSGGVASFAGIDSPFTKVIGLGFADAPSQAELGRVEQAFAAEGAGVQVELSTLAPTALGDLLGGRGYRLAGFENVLGRRLDAGGVPPVSDGVTVAATDDLGQWVHVVVEASMHADDQGVPSHEEFPRATVEQAEADLLSAHAMPFLAWRGDEPAGGAGYRAVGPVALLTGAATLPLHRRRGVQAALLATRLHHAAAAGCEVAVVTTQPGSTSQHNVQRAGFNLLYARAVLVRPAGG